MKSPPRLSLSLSPKKHWTNGFKTLIFVRGEFRTKNMLPNLLGKLKTPNFFLGVSISVLAIIKTSNNDCNDLDQL